MKPKNSKPKPPTSTHPWNRKRSGPTARFRCVGCGIEILSHKSDLGYNDYSATTHLVHDQAACARALLNQTDAKDLATRAIGTYWRWLNTKRPETP